MTELRIALKLHLILPEHSAVYTLTHSFPTILFQLSDTDFWSGRTTDGVPFSSSSAVAVHTGTSSGLGVRSQTLDEKAPGVRKKLRQVSDLG